MFLLLCFFGGLYLWDNNQYFTINNTIYPYIYIYTNNIIIIYIQNFINSRLGIQYITFVWNGVVDLVFDRCKAWWYYRWLSLHRVFSVNYWGQMFQFWPFKMPVVDVSENKIQFMELWPIDQHRNNWQKVLTVFGQEHMLNKIKQKGYDQETWLDG